MRIDAATLSAYRPPPRSQRAPFSPLSLARRAEVAADVIICDEPMPPPFAASAVARQAVDDMRRHALDEATTLTRAFQELHRFKEAIAASRRPSWYSSSLAAIEAELDGVLSLSRCIELFIATSDNYRRPLRDIGRSSRH